MALPVFYPQPYIGYCCDAGKTGRQTSTYIVGKREEDIHVVLLVLDLQSNRYSFRSTDSTLNVDYPSNTNAKKIVEWLDLDFPDGYVKTCDPREAQAYRDRMRTGDFSRLYSPDSEAEELSESDESI